MLEYRLDINVTENDFNEDGTVKLSSLLFFFQEAATQHADIIGVGMDTLLEKNIIWVLTKMKVRILKEVSAGDGYYVMTYPRTAKSRFCPRDYYLYNNAGELMVIGSGMWSLVDWVDRKVMRASEAGLEGPFVDGPFREDEAFPEGFEKFKIRNSQQVRNYTVAASDIDANEHTNNCRYADMISMAVDESYVREFVIQFSKETREGDVISLGVETVEDGKLVGGTLPDGQTVFQAKIIL